MLRKVSNYIRHHFNFVTLIALVIFSFLLGGGARDDIYSLVFLRPFAIICFGIGLFYLTKEAVNRYKYLLAFASLTLLLALAHLIPLPPEIWTALPGRQSAMKAAELAEIDQPWRPISLVPWRSINSFFALIVPAASLTLAVGCSRTQIAKLLPLILGIGMVSGIVGLLQLLGPEGGPLYFYKITNSSSAVGLFSNRNHQAAFLLCIIPGIYYYFSMNSQYRDLSGILNLICGLFIIFLIPLLLITGSRTGLLLLLPALLSIFIFAEIDSLKKHKIKYLSFIVTIVAASALTVFSGRAVSIVRLLTPDSSDNLRWDILGTNLEIGWKYFPFGSGIGTFVEVYQLDEPQRLLSEAYLNHAHNDWVEVFITMGLPAVVLGGLGCALWGFSAWRQFQMPKSSRSRLAMVGITMIILLVVFSAGDYPLRTPSLSVLMAIAAVWASTPPSRIKRRKIPKVS